MFRKIRKIYPQIIQSIILKIYEKSGAFISLEDLSNAVEETADLDGQAFQSITYQRKHNALTCMLRNPWKSSFILNEESDSLVENRSKLCGTKF